MTCMEAQSNITAFINDQLDMATLEEFLDHINHCSDCKEELEVYYALLTAMRLLDEDKELSNDFSEDLEVKLRVSADKIRRKKNARIRKRFYLMVISLGFIMISSIQVGTAVLIPSKPSKPSFLLNYSGVPKRLDPVDKFIKTYDTQAKIYTSRTREQRARLYRQLEQDKIWYQFIWEDEGVKQNEK